MTLGSAPIYTGPWKNDEPGTGYADILYPSGAPPFPSLLHSFMPPSSILSAVPASAVCTSRLCKCLQFNEGTETARDDAVELKLFLFYHECPRACRESAAVQFRNAIRAFRPESAASQRHKHMQHMPGHRYKGNVCDGCRDGRGSLWHQGPGSQVARCGSSPWPCSFLGLSPFFPFFETRMVIRRFCTGASGRRGLPVACPFLVFLHLNSFVWFRLEEADEMHGEGELHCSDGVYRGQFVQRPQKACFVFFRARAKERQGVFAPCRRGRTEGSEGGSKREQGVGGRVSKKKCLPLVALLLFSPGTAFGRARAGSSTRRAPYLDYP